MGGGGGTLDGSGGTLDPGAAFSSSSGSSYGVNLVFLYFFHSALSAINLAPSSFGLYES